MTDTLHDRQTVIDFLSSGRVEAGPSKVTLSKGVEEITLRKGSDGKWRYSYHSTYGNGSFIWSGDTSNPYDDGAYDASGLIITDAGTVDRLDAIIR